MVLMRLHRLQSHLRKMRVIDGTEGSTIDHFFTLTGVYKSHLLFWNTWGMIFSSEGLDSCVFLFVCFCSHPYLLYGSVIQNL